MMNTAHLFPCPNCGGTATRRYFIGNESPYNCCPNGQVTQTECPLCDYLMTICSLDGRVIRGQTSGIWNCDREHKQTQMIPVLR